MRINIRGAPNFNRDGVEVLPGLTVAELRSRLAALFGIDTNLYTISLLACGRLMQDADPLSSYDVHNGSTVNIVVQLREVKQLQQQQSAQQGSSIGGDAISIDFNAGNIPLQALAAAVFNSLGASMQHAVVPPVTAQPVPQQPSSQPHNTPHATSGGETTSGDAAATPSTQGAGRRRTLSSLISGLVKGASRKSRKGAIAAAQSTASHASTTPTSTTTTTASDSSADSGSDEEDKRRECKVIVHVGRSRDASRSKRRDAEGAGSREQREARKAGRHAQDIAAEVRQRARQAAEDMREESKNLTRSVKDVIRDSKAATAKALREAFAEWDDSFCEQDPVGPPPAARSAPEPQPVPSTPDTTTITTTKTSPPSMDVRIGGAASVPPPPPLYPSPKLPSSFSSEPTSPGSAVTQQQQQQPAVVHLHVHCTSEELDAMPERLRRLAEQVPVAQVVLQTDTTEQEGPSAASQPRTATRNTTTVTAAATAPTTSGATASATASPSVQVPWINEVLSTTMATLGMPQLMQLAAGNYHVLASLREPLQAQVQRRLAGTSDSLAVVAHVAHHEAQQLSTRILGMPAVQQLLERQSVHEAGQTLDAAQHTAASFRAELPRYLEHLYVAAMLHVRRTSLGAAEWSQELRNIFVRYTGMALTRSVAWFDEGRQAFQPVVANVMLSLLQGSGVQQQYPMLQAFSSMLGPMLYSLLGQWGREYEQNMQRSDDHATFEQTAAPSSPPHRTSPHSYDPAVARDLLQSPTPPQFEDVVKPTSSLHSGTSSSGLAASAAEMTTAAPPPPSSTVARSDCPESHLLPAWNARHLFGISEPQRQTALAGGTGLTAAAGAPAAAAKPTIVTAAHDELDDLANELMNGSDSDEDEKQPPTRAVSPKTRPLDAPPHAAVSAFSVTGGAVGDAAAALRPSAALEDAEAAAVAASQARLAAAVEDWEDSCGVPHAVAERLSAMASRYAQARSSASASLRRTTSEGTGASAPPQPPSAISIADTVDNSSDGWVTWEANPYGSESSRVGQRGG